MEYLYDVPVKIDPDYAKFLGRIAEQVDDLVEKPSNMQVFREKMRSFGDRWKSYVEDQDRLKKELKQHWKEAEANPAWRTKGKGKPPKDGWIWDAACFTWPVMAEMPAKLAPDVIASIESHIRQNKEKQKECVVNSPEYQKLEGVIQEHKGYVRDLRRELNKLKDKAIKETTWVGGGGLGRWWLDWLGWPDRQVIGCWRPKAIDIQENPLKWLIPSKDGGLPALASREEIYERFYIVLASIHGKMSGSETINNGMWKEELVKNIWWRLTLDKSYRPSEDFIKTALKRVKADFKAKSPYGASGQEPSNADAEAKKARRKTYFEKFAQISAHLDANPTAKSREIHEATGIHESDVRRIWGPIKKALKEGKRPRPTGSKHNGRTEQVDESASCQICGAPLRESFECVLCENIIRGECKTCHYTNTHPKDAIP